VWSSSTNLGRIISVIAHGPIRAWPGRTAMSAVVTAHPATDGGVTRRRPTRSASLPKIGEPSGRPTSVETNTAAVMIALVLDGTEDGGCSHDGYPCHA
jgi:hypothetical protein